MEILQLSALRSSSHSRRCRNLVHSKLNYSAISSQPPLESSTELPTLNCLLTTELLKVKVKVKVTLRLVVYRQSVRLGVKSLETHDQTFFFN
jgi:hypothetical protein